jgi:TonB-linked SusC/RagA family outer membrane protein
MKKHYITTLLCLTILTLSDTVWAQDFAYVPPPLSKLHVNDRKELKVMLISLEKKFHVYFAFESDIVENKYIPVGVKMTENLEETLFNLLAPFNLRFKKISDKFYTIYPNDEMASRQVTSTDFGLLPINQNYRAALTIPVMSTLPPLALTVTGTVKDENNLSLPGVNVLEKGTTNGTTTDASGNYSLNVQDENSVLIYSFIGYTSQEVTVNGRSIIDISLVPSLQSLQEVVVIGYGTVERKDLTGAVGSIGEKELQEVSVTNVESALLGKIPGVQVKPRDGAPGEPPQIMIRGVGSITAGSSPLYVVDGFPIQDLQTLNPNNIESIDVLKDASATAIYGSRGSNGVIIINTKRGKAGKTQISFDASYGLQKVSQIPDYMNAKEQARYAYWGAYFRNIDDGNDVSGPPGSWKFKTPQMVLDILDGKPHPDINWFNEVMRDAPVQRYQLSSSGGNEVVKFAVNGEYMDQDGILLGSNFKRYSLQANLDGQLSKRLAIKLNLNPSFTEAHGADPQGTGYGTTVLGNAASINAYTPVYQENGDYYVINGLPETGNFPNPVALANEVIDVSKNARFMGNLNAGYTIFDDLKLNVMLGGIFSSSKGLRFVPKLPSLLNATAAGTDDSSMGFNWITEYTLNYNKDFGEHQVTGLAGFTSQKSSTESNTISSVAYPNNLVPYMNAVSGLFSGGSSDLSEWSLVSYLARINYSYNNKYYVTASIRTDGSSRFGSANRYGLFPSIALAWRISDENFLKDVGFINDLKLRTSYGQTGNNNIGNYAALATVNNVKYPWGNTAVGGFVLQRMPNPNLTWEKQESLNLGMDASFSGGRFNLSVDHFKTKNKSLLLNVNIPTISGFSSALQNIGEVDNTGWEFMASSVNVKGKFGWSTDFNISTYKNEVIALGPEGDPIISSRHITMIGKPLGMFYGLVMDGIFETNAELAEGPLYNPGARNGTRLGDAKFKDFSGPEGVPDGIINSYDRVIIGSPYPDFYYGMTNRFSYGDFALSVSLQGVSGNQIASLSRTVGLRSEFRVAQLALANNFWISEEEPGDGNTPRPNDEPTGGIREYSTRHLEDGSYLRINNISLSYTVPTGIIQRLKLNALRIYMNASNPFTFSNTEGFNPDVNSSGNSLTPGQDNNNYPLPKSLLLGVNVSF